MSLKDLHVHICGGDVCVRDVFYDVGIYDVGSHQMIVEDDGELDDEDESSVSEEASHFL